MRYVTDIPLYRSLGKVAHMWDFIYRYSLNRSLDKVAHMWNIIDIPLYRSLGKVAHMWDITLTVQKLWPRLKFLMPQTQR